MNRNTILLSLFLTSGVSRAAFAALPPSPPADSSAVRQLVAQGDEFAEKIFDDQKALEKYTAALAVAPDNYDILCRLSRTYADIGEHLPIKTDAEKQKQAETYAKSLECAQRAVAVNPNGALGYTREAIAKGRIALSKGIWETIDLVKQTRDDCEKAIALDPHESLAYYVLGRTHAKVCEKPKFVRWPLGLGWANMDSAVANYERAIALRPDFIMYRLDCARAYVDLDEYAKARDQLTNIPSIAKAYEDDDRFRKEAADLLEKIKDK